jgi:phosphoribosylformylglycinamidine cyclo-ligase
VFEYFQAKGSIDEAEMFQAFNMGIGMVVVVEAQDAEVVRAHFASIGEPCYEIGSVVPGDGAVVYE